MAWIGRPSENKAVLSQQCHRLSRLRADCLIEILQEGGTGRARHKPQEGAIGRGHATYKKHRRQPRHATECWHTDEQARVIVLGEVTEIVTISYVDVWCRVGTRRDDQVTSGINSDQGINLSH